MTVKYMENSDTKNIIFCKKISKSFTEQKKEKDIKRVESEKWDFKYDDFLYENQLNNIKNIHSNECKFNDNISKITIQQISKKISGYKQQDIIKKKLDSQKFITLECIINKMVECELKCYYCKIEMNVLYDISRELKQWTVDRINNDLGHNYDNYYLACLECNLKRRRRSDEKFLFTKQMKLVKIDGEQK
jgi:hypothetical protein